MLAAFCCMGHTKWVVCLQVKADQAPYLCLDLSFQFTLLTTGFKIPETTRVSLVKKVKYHSQEVEAAWPLGAGINLIFQDKPSGEKH